MDDLPPSLSTRVFVVLAGLYGFCGVALGAMASHAAASPAAAEELRIAGLYALIHAPALLVISSRPLARFSPLQLGGWAFAAGVLLFCGSLSMKAAFGWRATLAPFGGTLLMAGWLLAGFSAFVSRR